MAIAAGAAVLEPLSTGFVSRYNETMSGLAHSSPSIAVWAARGGHGATTVAGALGILLDVPAVSHEPASLAWMWTESIGSGEGVTAIRDAGPIGSHTRSAPINLVVLRGPCSLAVRTLVPYADWIDHLVLIEEPWRPLRRLDVEAALSIPIGAVVPHSPRIARLSDAGLLSRYAAELEEFSGSDRPP